MFACGGWDYEVSLWFPVSLLCFFEMSSLLQSFHSRDVLNGLAERNVIQEWREKVHAWGKSSKNNPNSADAFSDLGGGGYFSEGCEQFDLICTTWLNLPRPSRGLSPPSPAFLPEEGKGGRHVGSKTREPGQTPSPWTSQGHTEQPTR